jgi:uncharacterized metal-binding protein YceD (DUF177 family)
VSEAALPPPEFSRMFDIREANGRSEALEANEAERAALARRFELVRIARLTAEITLTRGGDTVNAEGRFDAAWVQTCAVSGEDLAASASEPFHVRFVPARIGYAPNEEIELDADACDEIEFTGTAFDLGEAVAQTLGLAIDPFAVGPQAERARRSGLLSDEGSSGPFAALAALKKQ